uniref:FAR1 domain-containing protein n=1 Tax=Cucumis sativus TaxID=3659 RepID=A0A0A0LBE0_CUCSA
MMKNDTKNIRYNLEFFTFFIFFFTPFSLHPQLFSRSFFHINHPKQTPPPPPPLPFFLPSAQSTLPPLINVDADEGEEVIEGGSLESPAGTELNDCDGDIILEPYEGMEFESEDAAKIFYDKYARQLGFVMRVMSCRRSEKDGRILARRLGCNKEGHCVSIRGKFGAVRKPRPSTREGCKAMIHVKYDKSGKWVITKFVKEHNHPLVVSPREARQTMDEKDKQIQELTIELRNKKRLCSTYQEQLAAFMKIVEEHTDQLSKKVQNVVTNLKEFESIEQELLHPR